MEECYKCGASGNNVKLYSAISGRGVVKICGDCNSLEKLPIIKQPTDEQILASKNPRQASVSERLNNMSNRGRFMGQEPSLRSLVDKKFQANTVQIPLDIIPNFHWTIQRIRRSRKISREEFAKGIGEPESTVRMIEQGLLPEENYKIINKIEGFLKINLRKEGSEDTTKRYVLDSSLTEKPAFITPAPRKKLGFDKETIKSFKIADLKQMKKNEDKDEAVVWKEEYSQDDEQFLDKQENSEEDVE